MSLTTEQTNLIGEARPPKRLLLGPGPSEVDPVVLASLSMPPLGHLDPALLQLMDEVSIMLRAAFRTDNELTLAISGTGTSGMEAALANTIEAGDSVVVGVAGYFGERMCQIVERLGGKLTRVDAVWGEPVGAETMAAAIRRAHPRVVCIVHAETSTGVCQPIEEIARAAHDEDALLVVDAVTSLGGQPFYMDDWGVDVCYSGSQKCLGAPSGLAPFSMNEKAREKARNRKAPPATFYLDASLISKYWEERQYHHTISAPLVYGLHTALRLLHEEGIQRRWDRHQMNHAAFRAGVEAMGLSFLPAQEHSLWPLNAISLPEQSDEGAIRAELLSSHGIEIGGGLGPLKGKLLRVGLMGYGSRQAFVLQLLEALEAVLPKAGGPVKSGVGSAAAMEVYGSKRS